MLLVAGAVYCSCCLRFGCFGWLVVGTWFAVVFGLYCGIPSGRCLWFILLDLWCLWLCMFSLLRGLFVCGYGVFVLVLHFAVWFAGFVVECFGRLVGGFVWCVLFAVGLV